MEVFRIARAEYVRDLSGTGARMHGARWHLKGTGVIYTSESRALAGLEYLVHVPVSVIPGNLEIAVIKIPDSIKPQEVSLSGLPRNWRDYPAPQELAELGTEWVKSNRSLLLRVPSAVISYEFNVLINPSHRDMGRVKIKTVEPFEYDQRLLKKS